MCVLNSTECMEASRNYTRNSVIMSWFIVQVNQSLLSCGLSVEKNMMHRVIDVGPTCNFGKICGCIGGESNTKLNICLYPHPFSACQIDFVTPC